MVEFSPFGRADIVVGKIFGCLRDEAGESVVVFSDRGAPIRLDGDEARLFLVFVEEHRRPTPDAPDRAVIYGPQTAPRPTPEEIAVRKSST